MTQLFTTSQRRRDLEDHPDSMQVKINQNSEMHLQQCNDTGMLRWFYASRRRPGTWEPSGEVFFIKGHRSRNVKPKQN